MSKYMSESETLHTLNISDFSQIDSSNIMEFATVFKDIDPEVAGKALAMIPQLAKIALEVSESYKISYNRSIDSINQISANYNSFCSGIIDILSKLSEQPNNTSEDKKLIIDALLELESRKANFDRETRVAIREEREAFNNHTDMVFTAIVGIASLLGGIILGGMSNKRK